MIKHVFECLRCHDAGALRRNILCFMPDVYCNRSHALLGRSLMLAQSMLVTHCYRISEKASKKLSGMCRAGYAFAAAGLLEALYKQKTGKVIDLSEQAILNCDWNSSRCCGSYPSAPFW